MSLSLVPTNESASADPLTAPTASAAPRTTIASRLTVLLTRRRGGGCGGRRRRVAPATERRRSERRGSYHEDEREDPQRELELVARQRFAEDDGAGRDRAEVRRGARDGDHRHGVAHLEAARGHGESHHRREQDYERQRVDPAERALVEMVAEG